MAEEKKRLLLIDGSALLHRAYHAMPDLTDTKGRPAGAVYGFLRMLVNAMKDLEPSHVMVAFDRKEPTFRKELFVGYQANRPPLDEALGIQFGTVREVLEKLGVPVLDKAGFEADDVIGTLCELAVRSQESGGNKFGGDSGGVSRSSVELGGLSRNDNEMDEVIVVTGDKDLMQLVNDTVKLYLPVKGVSEAELVDSAGVVRKLGIKPEQVVEYKALVGDPSDNYPGVFGIGPKTAVNLLAQYGTFAKIYEHLEDLKPLVKGKLEAGRDGGELSHTLATIRRDVEIEADWELASKVASETGKWSGTLAEYGFKTLARQLQEREEKRFQEQMSLV